MFSFLFLSLAALFITPLSAFAEEPVSAELILDHERSSPGSEFKALLTLNIDPDWHLYWKNPGETGMAPSIEWKLPQGVEVVAEEWPAPEKGETSGLITFGYSEKLPIVFVFRIEPTFKGEAIDISADLSWVVCSSDTCLPGSFALAERLSVGASSIPDKKKSLRIEEALSGLPEKIAPLAIEKSGSKALIALPLENIREAEFYPEEDFGIDLHKPLVLFPVKEKGYTVIGVEIAGDAVPSIKGILMADGKRYSLTVQPSALREDLSIAALDLPLRPDDKTSVIPQESSEGENLGLGWAILFSFVGGLILNLMPCVLPVVSLKVLSFVQMAGESRREVFKQGALFSAGVLFSFWVLAGVLILLQKSGQAVGWGFQLQEPFFIALLALIFVLLGLSLFGVFEMGTSVAAMAGTASSDMKQKGASSSFWSGIFATAVATPCTGPFMGSALGYALTQPPHVSLLVFTSLGLGMSSPYLLLGMNPAWIRWMPKPGAWMEGFKQLMGFLMLLTTLWLLWVFVGQTNEQALFILAFALLAASFASWIYGRWGAPYKAKRTRYIAYFISGAVLIASVWVSFYASRSSLGYSEKGDVAVAESGWEPFSRERVEELRAQNIPVFIDFTAKWCLICQANHFTLTRGAADLALKEKGVVKMKADWTRYDPVITEELKKFGRSGVPLYVYYGPDKAEAELLPQVLTVESIVETVQKGAPLSDVR